MVKPNFKLKYYILVLAPCLLLSGYFATKILAQSSSDAIAVRIIPNPNHYSALRWYKEQGFKGSPQSIKVDGYEAVRDGRTVYVNAGNVDGANNVYTNINLLAYNLEAGNITSDIFGEMLSHWRFNTNLVAPGACSLATTSCLLDSDCPLKEYCNSNKASLVRDVKRLADRADIISYLEMYKNKKGHYPILKSGSYLPYVTISTWPSWQKVLAQELAVNLPVDPINKLGDCGNSRFNPVTCWDETRQEFAGAYTPPASAHNPPELSLPENSFVYVYRVSPDGMNYNITFGDEFTVIDAVQSDDSVVGGNHAPRFLGSSLQGYSGREFVGYVRAVDQDNDPLTWSIDTGGEVWEQWSAPPEVTVIGQGNYRLYAERAGRQGNYSFTFTVNDGRGEPNSEITRSFVIRITNPCPRITAPQITYTVSSTNPFIYTMTAADDVFTYPLSYEIVPTGILSDYNLPAPTFLTDANNVYYSFRLSGVFAPGNTTPPQKVYPVPQSGKQFSFTVNISDYYGATCGKDAVINLRNNRPVINLPIACSDRVRRGYTYPDCRVNAMDPDGNAITGYQYDNLPTALVFNNATGIVSGTVNFYTLPIAQTTVAIPVTARVTDEYGGESFVQRFNINIDSYCGDGIQQGNDVTINSVTYHGNAEGRGGVADQGYEQCDAAVADGSGLPAYSTHSRVATDACNSRTTAFVNGVSVQRQYGCTTYNNGTVNGGVCPPGSSSCAGLCVYTGGYCGDGVRQSSVTNRPGFSPESCDTGSNSQTCWVTQAPNGHCCTRTYCGDGVTQSTNGMGGAEQCDRGSQNGASNSDCNSNCRNAGCGDGELQTVSPFNEQCDLGDGVNSNSGQCTLSCLWSRCGDGHIQCPNHYGACETCDDGNTIDTDGCNNSCQGLCAPCIFNDPSSTFNNCCFQ